MPQDKKPQIGWSNYEATLRRFDIFYYKAQNLFPVVRDNRRLLPLLYDTVHEVYRTELPYYDNKTNDGSSMYSIYKEKHDRLKINVQNYISNNESYKRNNFGQLFNQLDDFFSDLTVAAATLNFLPPKIMPRDIQDKYEAVRQH